MSLTEAEYWEHRARLAETQIAGRREHFRVSRGRLKARAHTWSYGGGTTEPGIALIDRQGRIRGHLTTSQARRLFLDLARLIITTPNEGETK